LQAFIAFVCKVETNSVELIFTTVADLRFTTLRDRAREFLFPCCVLRGCIAG